MYSHCHRYEEADGGQVTKWQSLVARDHDGDKNGQRDENQAGRDYRGMTEQQRRIETNQEFLAAEFSLQTFTRLFGYRGEAIHNRFDHPGISSITAAVFTAS